MKNKQFQVNKIDFWEELLPEQQYEIEVGDLEIIKDKTIDYESFIAKHQKKLNKEI